MFVAGLAAASLLIQVRPASATTLREDFATDPATRGWSIAGDASLFHWDSTNQNLAVTWDSAKPNTYFYLPLGTVLSRGDDFSLGFDLRLDDIGIGVNTNKIYPTEVAVGFMNFAEASRTSFVRGTGTSSPDLVEFDYFWDAGYGATVWPACVSTNSSFDYNGATDYALYPLTSGDWYRVVMTCRAANQALVTTLTNLATLQGITITLPLNTNFTDFRADTVAVSSYTDTGDAYDSVLAHGAVDNLVVTVPPLPVTNLTGEFTNQVWQVQFTSQTNWLYTLERTADFGSWTAVAPAVAGTGTTLTSQDDHPPAGPAFYRLRADKP
jgi:hypothetical protein